MIATQHHHISKQQEQERNDRNRYCPCYDSQEDDTGCDSCSAGMKTPLLFHYDGDDHREYACIPQQEFRYDPVFTAVDNDGDSEHNRYCDATNVLNDVDIACIFLTDYENSRPCSLPNNISKIQQIHIFTHRIRYSFPWQCMLYAAIGCLFVSSCFDGQSGWRRAGHQDLMQFLLTLYSVIVLTLDVIMTSIHSDEDFLCDKRKNMERAVGGFLAGTPDTHTSTHITTTTTTDEGEEEEQEEDGCDVQGRNDDLNIGTCHHVEFLHQDNSSVGSNTMTSHNHDSKRKTRARKWKKPLLWMLVGVTIETWMKLIMDRKKFVWTACLKPLAFFYASSKARDALTALYHVSRIVFRVIFIELFLLLSFASIACHLYFDFDSYRDLPSAFLSLFEIQTTAATPGLWIPVYDKDRSCAIFFILFLIICVFFVHSIVLSVVFQTYINSMKILRQRAAADRKEAMRLAYLALKPAGSMIEDYQSFVESAKIRQVIERLRPHYNSEKIDVLMQIVDPHGHGVVEYSDFNSRMQRVLCTSLRSARKTSRHSLALSSLSVGIAISNMVYVLLFSSSPLEFMLLSNLIFPLGMIITVLGLVEVILRLRPCACLSTVQASRHRVLDGLAIVAGIVSITGVIAHAMQDSKGLQWLLLGRAIDMIRVMRLSSIFRSIVKRSGEVLPAIVGPLALVLTCLHVYTYTGMVLWGGAISIGAHNDRVTPLYDLNNFNDYPSGLLTMFNIFVVNDWQTIAGVYLTADRFSSPYIVYPFFIGANLVGVNIFLNVLTAFFVGAFVTKVEKKRDLGTMTDNSLRLSMSMRLETSHDNIVLNSTNDNRESAPCFHVLERRGYDTVISTITGDEPPDVSKNACGILETFMRIMPQGKDIGYLVAYSECKDYFVSPFFLTLVKGYIKHEDLLDNVVREIFITLSGKECGAEWKKHYHRQSDSKRLVLTASFCSQRPKMLLVVANIAGSSESHR